MVCSVTPETGNSHVKMMSDPRDGIDRTKISNQKQVTARPSLSDSFKLFEFYYRVAVFVNAIPFTYDSHKRRFDYQAGFKSSLWFGMTFLGIVCETVVVTKVLIETKLDREFPASEWSLIMFVFLSWICVCGLHWNIHSRKEEMSSYFNQLIGIREYFTEEKLPPSGDYRVVRICLYSLTVNFPVQSLMVALEGRKPTYLYSLWPEKHLSIVTHWIWYIYAYWRVLTNFCIAIFVIFTGFMHVQTFDQIFRYRSMEKRTLRESLHIYRMLQIFANRFNRNFSTMCIPYITMFACGNIILGLYGTLRFFGKLAPEAYLNLPLMGGLMVAFCLTYYPRMARVKEASKEEYKAMMNECVRWGPTLRKLMKASQDEKHRQAVKAQQGHFMARRQGPTLELFQRKHQQVARIAVNGVDEDSDELSYRKYKEILCTVRACPPIGVNMGSFYQIKQSTVMTLFNFIACNTISALLTWK